MNTPNNIILSITGIAIKTYMLVAIIWSESNKRYKNLLKALPAAPQLSASR